MGKGFSSPFGADTGPTAWLTPVYPYILVGIFKLFGIAGARSVVAAAALNEIFSALTIIPVFYIGKRIGGRYLGAGAAWLWTIHPFSIYVAYYWLWYNSLSALLTALILWATMAIRDSEKARDWIGYGLLWGASLLTNASVLALAPFVFAWLIWTMRKQRHAGAFGLPGLALLFASLVCAPWIIRNYEVFHQFLPLRSNFGFELWAENRIAPADPAADAVADTNLLLRLGEVPYCQEREREAFQFMRENPRMELSLIWGRFLETWTGDPHPVWKLVVKGWTRRAELVLYSGFSLLALGGILLLLREKSEFSWLLAAHPLAFPLVYYLTHTSYAYRLPIDPVLVILASVALAGLCRMSWRPETRAGGAPR